MISYSTVKRLLDIIFSVVMIVMVAPLFLIVAIAIKLESEGPVLFKQERLGYRGRIFEIYKFRSMIVNAERLGTGVYSSKGDPRVTKIGEIIRKTSIDELPQLINILKGEMSFIGPRPTLVRHPWSFDEYTEEQKRRFNVLPGVTGLAQINGRKTVPWPERMILDVQYVNDINFLLDTKIFIITVWKIIIMADNYNTIQTVKLSKRSEDN